MPPGSSGCGCRRHGASNLESSRPCCRTAPPWFCARCTLSNPPNVVVCQVCEAARPVEIDAAEESPGIPPHRRCERKRWERAASPDVVEVCADDGDAADGGDNRATAANKGKIIYSKDHATGEGARTGADIAADPQPKRAPKKQRTRDAIMCMLGDMNTSFNDALKTTERLHMQQITPPADILAALDKIPDFSQSDKLRAYGKLVLSERLFLALMELPMHFRKEWLLMLN